MTRSHATVYATQQGPQYPCAGVITRHLGPDEPAYLYCAANLQRRAERFQRGFPGIVSYAVKANPECRVLHTLSVQGLSHFDVASLGEVRAVRAINPAATLHFNNPIKAFDAIAAAHREHGVRSFALDEISELEKIRRATGGDPQVMFTVRFKLEHSSAAYDFGSKFGATPAKAARLLRAIAGSGARAALTFHPGSQCTDPAMYRRYLETAAAIERDAGVRAALINVGGGFPEYYENTEAPALETYFTAIRQAADDYFETPPLLMCEPGRGMVASAVSLLSQVIHVREEEHALFVNDGVYGGMQEQTLVDLRLPVRVWRDGEHLTGSAAHYRIFGPTCDPIDRLPGEIALPGAIRSGDYLEFGLLGAYGSATSTAFNGFSSGRYFNVARGFSPTR